jgi:RNA polymerase sigma-70 factor (ECF subfamily)
MPDEPEAAGLLALTLFQDSRRETRLDGNGDLVTLADQDRTRWDQTAIEDGVHTLETALRQGKIGPYQLQAAIAGCHATAKHADDTDWAEIAELYAIVAKINPSPVVDLNRAVAVAMTDGPAAGLKTVEALRDSGKLDGYHLLPATRADMLRRLGRTGEAAEAYREALELAPTDAERRFLTRRLTELAEG